ncbi:MAG: hypothetical protein IJY65_03345 [Clostridia bacterium]|nr:hypothetical protein [Clostridia bacterium]
MKKFLCALLSLIFLSFSLVSCSESKYEPVESTDEERRVVMTLSLDGKSYDVKYELYRALFVATHATVDGGDASVWSGDKKDEYIVRVDDLIARRAAEIYSVFHLCQKNGIDLYNDEVDEVVESYVTVSVEGGTIGGVDVTGYESYEKYLEYLASIGMNYSVQDLLYRYTVGLEKLDEYFLGTVDQSNISNNVVFGSIKYTEEDISDFYYGDDSVRIIRAFFDSSVKSREVVEGYQDDISKMSNDAEVASYIIQRSLLAGSDVMNGIVVGRYNLDSLYYSKVTEAAFSLPLTGVSEVIEINSESEQGYCIVYVAHKTEEHFTECYDDIVEMYLQNEVGRIMSDAADSLVEGLAVKSALGSIDRAAILGD